MRETLIVARMNPRDAGHVAEIFAESDAGDLPRALGVTERRLYRFHDLYLHLISAAEDVTEPLADMREHPLFTDVSQRLSKYISAYDPETWREPTDAMAEEFYRWRAH